MKKFYPLFGIARPIIYILAVIIGGAIRSDYSFLYNTISELTLINAPNLLLISILFGIYNFSLLIFGTGAFLDNEIDANRKYKAATLMLAIIGVLGLLLLFFPRIQETMQLHYHTYCTCRNYLPSYAYFSPLDWNKFQEN